MREGTIGTLVLLTFLGMVGLYVGLYLAWQKYQTYAPTLDKLSADATAVAGSGSAVTGLLSLLSPSK
jgi:hypothetical protein